MSSFEQSEKKCSKMAFQSRGEEGAPNVGFVDITPYILLGYYAWEPEETNKVLDNLNIV